MTLKEESAFQKLAASKKKGKEGQREIEAGQVLQNEIEQMLRTFDASVVDNNRPEFELRLSSALEHVGIKLPAPLRKAILNVMSERDESAEICLDANGDPEPDAALRDYENVPLKEDIHAYFDREVRPHVPDAWIDESKTKIGYEIPFNRHFYVFKPPRSLDEIDADLKGVASRIMTMLEGLAE
jgi:type I restriction enzyme M protein